jgi:hypothetical protein
MLKATMLSLCLLAGSAFAQEDAATKTRGKALELIREVVPKEAYEAMIDQMYTQMGASMGQMGQKLSPADMKKLGDVVREVMTYDELVQWSADVYVKHFTLKELEDLAKFYRTPTGKKAARLLPKLGGEIGAIFGPLIMQRMPAAMKKHGLLPGGAAGGPTPGGH